MERHISPQPPEKKDSKRREVFIETIHFILNLIVIFLVVLIIRTFVVAPFQVSGASMMDTLDDKEYIIVNKIVYNSFFGTIHRGDIVVLVPPISKETYYIKRVIGLPGETVKFNNNTVSIINQEHPGGFVLNEPYVRCMEKKDGSVINNCDYTKLAQNEFKVPENSYFVMGDNRMNSTDSRFCFYSCTAPNSTPFVTKEHIIGKTWFVIWPLTHIRFMQDVTYKEGS